MLVRSPARFRLNLAMSLLVTAAAGTPAQTSSPTNPVLHGLPREFEVRLALSAAPPHLRAGAAVYVLDPATGYVLERQGSNGFTCYVERTDYTRAYFRDDYVVPECQDAEGTRTIARVEFDVERLRAEGRLTPQQLKDEISRRFKDSVYRAPARPGIAYMLAPVAQLNGGPATSTTIPMNMPHIMYFAPNLTGADIGGGPVMGAYPYLIGSGPMAYVILNVGEAEKARINRESADLLADACRYRSFLCLDGPLNGGPGQ